MRQQNDREEQFAAVRRGEASSLDLTLDGLSEIPDEVYTLDQLETLDLSGNRIEVVPDQLGRLPNLRHVRLYDNPIRRLSNTAGVALGLDWHTYRALQVPTTYISELRIDLDKPIDVAELQLLSETKQLQLRALRFSSPLAVDENVDYHVAKLHGWRAIDYRIDTILAAQPALEEFSLWGVPLRRVPYGLRSLDRLADLTLAGVFPKEVPAWLFEMPSLEHLDLTHNDLRDLPRQVRGAAQLKTLSLESNRRMTRIPAGVFALRSLETLKLFGTSIDTIPVEILWLKKLEQLGVTAKQMIEPPPEIVAKGLDEIRGYWRQRRESGVDYLTEAKLLIVGEAGAGKTSLARKIIDPSYELAPDESSTEGIDILTDWRFPSGIRVVEDGRERVVPKEFRVNMWDFGGQEIYYHTHQFFLTKRSVYALVADVRKEDTAFDYWLEVVDLLSDGSPLVIVQNEKQDRKRALDMGALRERFENLKMAIAVNLADNRGLEDVIDRLQRELEALPHIGAPLPQTWHDVREALDGDERDYISLDVYLDLCAEHGFSRTVDMIQLSGYLHDLGVCLHFQDDPLLSKTMILKPEWGTEAVYRVLNDEAVIEQLGRFGAEDIERIWYEDRYAAMHHELVQLMTKFGLCFPIPGAKRAWIAPQLLATKRPDYHWDTAENLIMRYEYDFMPKGIVHSLIVELHDLIAEGDLVWRHGVVFEQDGNWAEVVEDYRRRRMTLRFRGADPSGLLAIIDRELTAFHQRYPKLSVEQLLPCGCATCATESDPTLFPVRDLLDFAQTRDRIQCRKSRELRDAEQQLRWLLPHRLVEARLSSDADFADSGRRRPSAQEVFVSYHWDEESITIVDEVQQRFEARGVTVLRDRDELRYKDSISAFMDRLGRSSCVVAVIGEKYLRSKSCMYELTTLAAGRDLRKRICPVFLEDAGIFEGIDRIKHVKYWEQKKKELNDAMKDVGSEHLHGIREEIDLFDRFRATIAQIVDVLADMKTFFADELRSKGFEELHEAIEVSLTR